MASHTIETIEITGSERNRLLSIEESHFVDLKAIQVSTKKLGVAITAFANAAGGDLYVGIGETEILGTKTRHWHGFNDVEAANGHIQSLDALFPLGSEYSYEFLRALVTCPCRFPPVEVRVRPCEGRTNEASPVYGRTDHRRTAGA